MHYKSLSTSLSMKQVLMNFLLCSIFLAYTKGALAYADMAKSSPNDSKTQSSNHPQSKIAKLEVKIDPKFVRKEATGIRTLYIIVYNADSEMPMPYGAVKIDLDKDANDTFYQGQLDTDNVMVMSGGPVPESLRIKARLDKDGSAGKDSPGDLVGIADHVKPGSTVTITIDKAI